MFAIDEAKLPPPRPAVAAASSRAQYAVDGSETSHASSSVGINSSSALTTVQVRPPKRAGAKVYGNRAVAPTSPGIDTSQNSWPVVSENPASLSLTATTLQSCQTEKPRNSAKIEKPRLRRATRAPVSAQKSAS